MPLSACFRAYRIFCSVYLDLNAFATVFELLLDGFEGLAKGYDKHAISCDIDNTIYHAFTYLAAPQAIDVSLKPYHWYKQLVLAGARHHCFPESYIAYLEGIDSIPDPDPERMIMNEGLLEEIERFS